MALKPYKISELLANAAVAYKRLPTPFYCQAITCYVPAGSYVDIMNVPEPDETPETHQDTLIEFNVTERMICFPEKIDLSNKLARLYNGSGGTTEVTVTFWR